eukprot:13294254-Heterocapsa_arctica.AAC.1
MLPTGKAGFHSLAASVVRPVQGAVPGREPPLEGSRPMEGATLAEGYSRVEQRFQKSIREPSRTKLQGVYSRAEQRFQ